MVQGVGSREGGQPMMTTDDWEQHIASLWDGLDDLQPGEFRERMDALAAERPPGDAAALFELPHIRQQQSSILVEKDQHRRSSGRWTTLEANSARSLSKPPVASQRIGAWRVWYRT